MIRYLKSNRSSTVEVDSATLGAGKLTIGGYSIPVHLLRMVTLASGGVFALCLEPVNTRPQSSTPPPIRVSTRLVQLSVVVEDKRGNPVTGLTKNDFAVVDDRRPQDISTFSMTTNRPPDAATSRVDPDSYTNRPAGGMPPNISVILLDGLNTQFTDQAYAREQVVRFLTQIQPQDRVALYTLGNDLTILHDFTSDATSLLAALQKYSGHISAALDASEPEAKGREYDAGRTSADDLLGGFLNGRTETPSAQDEEGFFFQDRARRTLFALLQIAYHVSSRPGRKSLIWVSGGFPLIPSYLFYGINTPGENFLFANGLDRAASEFNNASLVVYPVDAHGLTVSRPNPGNFITMKALADRTGGRAFYNTNDIRGAIRAAINDSRATYELGYYPDGANWDGRFHTINVRVSRPGTHVRTRQGYLAVPERTITPEMRQAVISQALTRLVESEHIGVSVHVSTNDTNGRGHALTLGVRFNPHELRLKEQDGVFAGMAEIVFLQLDSEHRVIDTIQQRYLLNLLPETYAHSRDEGFSLSKDVRIQPKAQELRVVLRDVSTGLSGAVAVPLAKYFPNQRLQ